MRTSLCGTLILLVGSVAAGADLELKIVANKYSYTLDRGGKTAADYEKAIRGSANNPVPPPAVDLKLEITNKGKAPATVYLGGDPNVVTLDLKGPGVAYLAPALATTREFRLPKAAKIEPGKSHSIPLKQLSDGQRGIGRYVYWLDAGEYKLSATYQLSGNGDGEKGPLLKAEPVTLKVELKK